MIDQSFASLVQSFAAKTPTPGGGAAAAMAACLGTSLMLMAVRFSRGKKSTLEFDEQLAAVEGQLDHHLGILMPMAERDCASFDHVSRAYGLPKATDEEQAIRAKAIEEGMLGAMVVPEETLCMVRDVMSAGAGAIRFVGKNIASDLGSGAEMLAAGAESAFYNVRINAAYLKDRERAEAALERNRQVIEEVRGHLATFRGAVEGMIG